uniref:Ig-like domain-containing protein n=1 Tax=Arundo donax TaxID=35708 RepID=A0A0A9B9B7_ARUDO
MMMAQITLACSRRGLHKLSGTSRSPQTSIYWFRFGLQLRMETTMCLLPQGSLLYLTTRASGFFSTGLYP